MDISQIINELGEDRESYFNTVAANIYGSLLFCPISLLINETKLSLIGLGVLAGFIALYFVVKAIKPDNQPTS